MAPSDPRQLGCQAGPVLEPLEMLDDRVGECYVEALIAERQPATVG
jgi:hypothetical protein